MTVTDIKNRKALGAGQYHDDIGKSYYNNGAYPAVDYKQILFRPGQVVQNRELNYLQTILHEKIKDERDINFKNGSIVTGCHSTISQISSSGGLQYYTIDIDEGIVYWDGIFFKTPIYSATFNESAPVQFGSENAYYINFGLNPVYETIDSSIDNNLGDPVILYQLSTKLRGADRLRITFNLVREDIEYDSSLEKIQRSTAFNSAYKQYFQIVSLKCTWNNFFTFEVEDINRVYNQKEEDIKSNDTYIQDGLNIYPLYGLENYLYGGSGSFSGQFKLENSSSDIWGAAYGMYNNTMHVDMNDFPEPFIIQITDGTGLLNGKNIINSYCKTYAFDKAVSTDLISNVTDILYSNDVIRTFKGSPFQVFTYEIKASSTSGAVTQFQQLASLFTGDNAIFSHNSYSGKLQTNSTYKNYTALSAANGFGFDGAGVANKFFKPGTKVEFVITEYESSTGQTFNTDTTLGTAYISQVLPINYYVIPYSNTGNIPFIVSPFDMYEFLKNATAPNHIEKIITVFGAFYHRFEFESSYNFGHLLEWDEYTVGAISSSGAVHCANATITKIRTDINISDIAADYNVDIQLFTNPDKKYFTDVTLNNKIDSITNFHILPNIKLLRSDPELFVTYFPKYPNEIISPIQKLSYPYEKETTSVEITTVINGECASEGPDVPAPDYFSIQLATTDLNNNVFEISKIEGLKTLSGISYYWNIFNDNRTIDQDINGVTNVKFGESIAVEMNSDNKTVHSIKATSRNIEAEETYGIAISFSSPAMRTSLVSQLNTTNGAFMHMAGVKSDGSHPVPADMSNIALLYRVDPNSNYGPSVVRIFDWKEDLVDTSKLQIAFSRIRCYDIYKTTGGKYTHISSNFDIDEFIKNITTETLVFYDARTTSTYKTHDILQYSGAPISATKVDGTANNFNLNSNYSLYGKGTYYNNVDSISGRKCKITPILPHSNHFCATMPQYYSASTEKNITVFHKTGAVINATAFGKKLHDGDTNIIEHEVRFDDSAKMLKIDKLTLDEMNAQMHKTKEAFGTYYENITGNNGYHVVDRYKLKYNNTSNIDTAALNSMSNIPFCGFETDALSTLFAAYNTEKWLGYVNVSYNIWMPSLVHFYADAENKINYNVMAPGMLAKIDNIYIHDSLYLGSTHIPPMGFYGYPQIIKNINKELLQYSTDILNIAKAQYNTNMNDLQSTFNELNRENSELSIFGTDVNGVAIAIENLKHRFANPYVIDLYLLKRDNNVNWNNNIIASSLESQEITGEFKTTQITFDTPYESGYSTPWTKHGMVSYVAYGREYLTLPPIGELDLVNTGSVNNYSSTENASYAIEGVYDGFKIKRLINRDITDDMPGRDKKYYDTCAINQFGFFKTNVDKKITTNESITAKTYDLYYGAPLSRTYFTAMKDSTENTDFLLHQQNITTINYEKEYYLPIANFGQYSNTVFAKEMYRNSWFDSGENGSLENGCSVFGIYPIVFKSSIEMFEDELNLNLADTANYGKATGLSFLTIDISNIPCLPYIWNNARIATYQYTVNSDVDLINNAYVDLWSSWYWIQWYYPTLKADATSDFLQSIIPAGTHKFGVTQANVGVGNYLNCMSFSKLNKYGTGWNYFDSEYEYINKNTIEPYVYTYKSIENVSVNNNFYLDLINSESDSDNIILPKLAQSYKFKNDYILKRVKIHINSDPWIDNVYSTGVFSYGNEKESVAIYFGYLINGKVDANGFIHTEFLTKFDIIDNAFEIDLPLPIHIKADKEFFIGILHMNYSETESAESATPELLVKVIDNGSYSLTDNTLIPYPANFESKLLINNEAYTNKMLKLDLVAYQYDIDTAYVETSDILSRSGNYSPTEIVKFLVLTDNIQPYDTFISNYFYETTNDNTTWVWSPYTPKFERVTKNIQDEFRLRFTVETNSKNVSPIVKCGSNPAVYVSEYQKYGSAPHYVAPTTINDSTLTFTDKVGDIDNCAKHTIIRPYNYMNEFGKAFYQNNYSVKQNVDSAFWADDAGILGLISLYTQEINGSILEIELKDLKSVNTWYANDVDGLTSGISPFGYKIITDIDFSESVFGTHNVEMKFPAQLIRIQFDFYDVNYTDRSMTYTDIPLQLCYKENGYKSIESKILDISGSGGMTEEQQVWKTVIAYPKNYCYQDQIIQSPGVTIKIEKLDGNWFRQTVEFIPMGAELNKTFTPIFMLGNNNSFSISAKPKVLWPAENYKFLLRIGLENVNGNTPTIKNIKTSLDSVSFRMDYENVKYFTVTPVLTGNKLGGVFGTYLVEGREPM